MKLKSKKGSSLAQYAIVLAIIAVGLVPVFIIMGDSIKQHLENFNSSMEENNKTIENNQNGASIANEDVKPGDIGGSSVAPKIQCQNSSCVIDFGDYVINGIPGDFSEYIEGSGSAGGTEKLAAILQEIADNAPVDEETRNLLQQLAQNGHGMAQIERGFHEDITKLIDLGTFDRSDVDLDAPIDLSEGPNMLDFQDILQQLNNSMGTNTDPNYQSTLMMVNILSNDILNIASTVQSKTSRMLLDADNDLTITEEDAQEYIDFIHDGSNATDLDSAIICTSGNGQDNGYNCN